MSRKLRETVNQLNETINKQEQMMDALRGEVRHRWGYRSFLGGGEGQRTACGSSTGHEIVQNSGEETGAQVSFL